MTVDLDALEAAARAATPGPWTADAPERPEWVYAGDRVSYPVADCLNLMNPPKGERTAAFIAAVDPTTVLALIGRIRELEQAASVEHPDISTSSVSGPPNRPQGEVLKLQTNQ